MPLQRFRPRSAVASFAPILLLLGLSTLFGAGIAGVAGAELAVPDFSRRVEDRAGLLSAEEVQTLEAKLAAFESDPGHQIIVLTVPTLEGEAIESFSLRVAEAWKIGRAGFDNGVLVVVAARDRRARIEVGYGLEGVIPDAIAARILREQMIPAFKQGRMGLGVVQGVDALMAAARGEEIPLPARARRGSEDSSASILHAVILGAFVGAIFGGPFGRARRWLAPVVSGGIAAVIVYVVTALALAALFAAGIGGLVGFLWARAGGGGSSGGYRGGGPGGFGMGGGSFGGGGFGGGGFSGGFGGGFGGGGASGSW